MIIFDEKYYTDIWETIHRHDYCEDLANRLVKQYGKCRILDIGTGCGFLVKTLREKGCDAWGLEVSEYAVKNSCDENIKLGTVLHIPFESNRFDVVHSQGLWEYISEEKIQKAWSECNRVGKAQEHNIDTTEDTAEWTKDFLTHKTHEWWEEKLKLRLNVGCGNYHLDGFTHIDFSCPEADLEHDLTTPLPFNNNSVDEIYASHIIEHFSRKEWELVKTDWSRVMKSGGKMTVSCPNFEKCLEKWVTDKTTDYWLQTIYGSQSDDGNFHKNGFTRETLIQELSGVGFVDFEVVKDTAEDMEVLCTKS